METDTDFERPQWHEYLVGYALIAGSGWYAFHLVHHTDQAWPWYVWAAAGAVFLFGVLVAWPRRTQWLLTQAMNRVPGLPNVEGETDG